MCCAAEKKLQINWVYCNCHLINRAIDIGLDVSELKERLLKKAKKLTQYFYSSNKAAEEVIIIIYYALYSLPAVEKRTQMLALSTLHCKLNAQPVGHQHQQ